MTKHKIPNWEEYKNYQPNSEFLDLIDQYVSSSNGKKKVKILDWGCGRGQQVLYFREQGLEAFGVDVDCSTIDNGKPLIKKIGYEPKILKLIQLTCLQMKLRG